MKIRNYRGDGMIVNKKAIIIFIYFIIPSFIVSVITIFLPSCSFVTWLQGFSFAIFGSSLIALFTAIINYYVEKKKHIENIAINLINLDNEAHAKYYYVRKQTVDNLVETIGVCCTYYNNIQNLLLSYKEGLFKNSKEIKKVDDFGHCLCEKYIIKVSTIGDLIKTEKEYVVQNLESFANKLKNIIENQEIYNHINNLLKNNGSAIKIEIIRNHIGVIIEKLNLKDDIERTKNNIKNENKKM